MVDKKSQQGAFTIFKKGSRNPLLKSAFFYFESRAPRYKGWFFILLKQQEGVFLSCRKTPRKVLRLFRVLAHPVAAATFGTATLMASGFRFIHHDAGIDTYHDCEDQQNPSPNSHCVRLLMTSYFVARKQGISD